MTDIMEIIPFGKQEPELSKLTKALYCLEQYEHPFKKINYKKFIENIKHHCEIHSFDWTCKHPNGRRKYPKYDSGENCAKNWIRTYDYPGAYKIYADHKNKTDRVNLTYAKTIYQHMDVETLTLEAQNILEDIKQLPRDENYSKNKKSLMETYKLILIIINQILMIETAQKFEVNGNIKSENLNVEVKSTEEALKEHEDSISRFISRRLTKTD